MLINIDNYNYSRVVPWVIASEIFPVSVRGNLTRLYI